MDKHGCHSIVVVDAGDCQPGYYCTSAAYLDVPNDNVTGSICPQFYFCVASSPVPALCSIGYMANRTGMSACEKCLAGFLCIPGEAPRICAQGMAFDVAAVHLIKGDIQCFLGLDFSITIYIYICLRHNVFTHVVKQDSRHLPATHRSASQCITCWTVESRVATSSPIQGIVLNT